MSNNAGSRNLNSLARNGFIFALIAAALDVLLFPVMWFLPVAVFIPIGLGISGLVMGHRGLKRVKQSGERGRGLAIAAIVLGYIVVGLVGLLIAIAILAFLLALPRLGQMTEVN